MKIRPVPTVAVDAHSRVAHGLGCVRGDLLGVVVWYADKALAGAWHP